MPGDSDVRLQSLGAVEFVYILGAPSRTWWVDYFDLHAVLEVLRDHHGLRLAVYSARHKAYGAVVRAVADAIGIDSAEADDAHGAPLALVIGFDPSEAGDCTVVHEVVRYETPSISPRED